MKVLTSGLFCVNRTLQLMVDNTISIPSLLIMLWYKTTLMFSILTLLVKVILVCLPLWLMVFPCLGLMEIAVSFQLIWMNVEDIQSKILSHKLWISTTYPFYHYHVPSTLTMPYTIKCLRGCIYYTNGNSQLQATTLSTCCEMFIHVLAANSSYSFANYESKFNISTNQASLFI